MSTTDQDRAFETGGPFNNTCPVPAPPAPGPVTFTFTINAQGHLIEVFSNGTQNDLGKVTGTNGNDGVSITGGSLDGQGNLILQLSNGQTVNVGSVKGKDGTNATPLSTVTLNAPTTPLLFPQGNHQYLVHASWPAATGTFDPTPLRSKPNPGADSEWFLEESKSGPTDAYWTVFIPSLSGTNPYGPVSMFPSALLVGVWSNRQNLTISPTWDNPKLLA